MGFHLIHSAASVSDTRYSCSSSSKTKRSDQLDRGYLLFREVYEHPQFDVVSFYEHCVAAKINSESQRVDMDPFFNGT